MSKPWEAARPRRVRIIAGGKPWEAARPRRVWIIAGGKGGVGKSTLAFSLADFMERHGEALELVDGDTANADLFKAYERSGLPVSKIDMTKEPGWKALSNWCEKADDRQIVVNTKGGNADDVLEYGEQLNGALASMPGRAVVLFVIENSIDSTLHLRKFRLVMPDVTIHVIKNAKFGSPEVFTSYDESDVAKEVAASGGKVVVLPKGSDLITEGYRLRRQTLKQAHDTGMLFDKSTITLWRKKMDLLFNELMAIVGDEAGQP